MSSISSRQTAGTSGASLPSQTGNSGKVLSTDGTNPLWAAAAAGSALTPTATKTAPYTGVKNDLAMMDAVAGASTFTFPASPANGDTVGVTLVTANAAFPLTLNGNGATLGTSGLTTGTIVIPETTVYQYDATNTRWLTIARVSPKASLDSLYFSTTATPPYDLRPLRTWRTALAKVDTAKAAILVVGDSISEGYGTADLRDRWINRMGVRLQKEQNLLGYGGFGFLNIYTSISGGYGTTAPNRWAKSGGGAQSAGSGFLGFRKYNFVANETATLTFSGTSFTLHYAQGMATDTPFTISIDGGGAITVTPTTTGGSTEKGVYTSSVLSQGSHTVVITPQSGSTLRIRGAHIFDGDETGGVHVWENALFGLRTDSLALNVSQLDSAVAITLPSLVIIMAGTNDYQNGAISVSAFKANLLTAINRVKSAATTAAITTPSILLVGEYKRIDGGSVVEPWTKYTQAMIDLSVADPTNVGFLDLAARLDPTVATYGIMSDNVHPNVQGHRYVGETVAAYLRHV